MKDSEEITLLKEEVKALKTEVAGLKEFIRAMYSMMNEDDEYDDTPYELYGSPGMGRYNT